MYIISPIKNYSQDKLKNKYYIYQTKWSIVYKYLLY